MQFTVRRGGETSLKDEKSDDGILFPSQRTNSQNSSGVHFTEKSFFQSFGTQRF